MPLGKEVGQAS